MPIYSSAVAKTTTSTLPVALLSSEAMCYANGVVTELPCARRQVAPKWISDALRHELQFCIKIYLLVL